MAGNAPSFAFVWQTAAPHLLEKQPGTLLIWPLTERRPSGAFARFIVVKDELAGFVVPMDLDSPPGTGGKYPPANAGYSRGQAVGVQEDLASLPLLLRLPFADHFTVTVTYLVSGRENGRTLVVEVATPAIAFRSDAVPRQLMLVGLVRGENSGRPDRPVVVPAIGHAIDETTGSIDPSKHIELADTVLDAYEGADGDHRRRIGTAFVLAIPHQDHEVIGPAQPIFPYSGAHVPASMEFLLSEEGAEEGVSVALSCPRLSLRVGTSRASQAELEPSVRFFHWNRTAAFARTADRNPGSAVPSLTVHHGELHDGDLSFAFRQAAFGDVVGLMTGPPENLTPAFPDWPNSQQYSIRMDGWTVTPFVSTGHEMIALNYYSHAETVAINSAINRDLDAMIDRVRPPRRPDRSSEIAKYLLEKPTTGSIVDRLIRRAIEDHSDRGVASLDCYSELLRELNQQLRWDSAAGDWRRLENLFSFAMFERAPELFRALVVSQELRRGLLAGFEDEGGALDTYHVLALAMRAGGLSEQAEPRVSPWLNALQPTGISVAWELMKRDQELVRDLVRQDVMPDLALLSDWFDGRAKQILNTYAGYPADSLSQAAGARRAQGYRMEFDLLQQAHRHRLGSGSGGNLFAYGKIAEVVELMRGAAGPSPSA